MSRNRFSIWLVALLAIALVLGLPGASGDGRGLGFLIGAVLGQGLGLFLISGAIPLLWWGIRRRFEVAQARGPLLLWTLLLIVFGIANLLRAASEQV